MTQNHLDSLNRRIVLDHRPTGRASAANFRMETAPIPEPGPGQVLVRHHYMSVDPYMRGRMNAGRSYAVAQAVGEVMGGGTVGEVIASQHADAQVGDFVVTRGGWQEYALVTPARGEMLRRVEGRAHPLSWHLGALGMPGITAYVGLVVVAQIQAGETVVCSAAAGAVGSAVAAVAKGRGCRVIGIAGGAEKCRYAVEELGYDLCLDYKAHADAASLSKALEEACPEGVDVYFENVGGMVQEAVLPRLKDHGRIAVCGLIAGYDGAPMPMAEPRWILTSRLRIQGFTVGDYQQHWDDALKELEARADDGSLRPRESIAQGLENAPEAFLGLLRGHNLGKQLVRLIP